MKDKKVSKKCSGSGKELQKLKTSKAGKELGKCGKKVTKLKKLKTKLKIKKPKIVKVKPLKTKLKIKKPKPTTYYMLFRKDKLTQTGNNFDASRSSRNRERVEEQMNMKLHSWGVRSRGEEWLLTTFEADKKKVEDWEKSFSLRDFMDLKNQTSLYTMTGKKKNYNWKHRLTDEEFQRIYS